MSIQASIIKALTRRTIRRHGLDEEQVIRHLRRVFNSTPSISLLPRGVRVRHIDTRAFQGDHLSAGGDDVTILYIHGGAYVGGQLHTYHNLAGRLAKRLNGEVFLVKYPFAPEHPFPAAVNRVLEAYEFLLNEGKDPANIVIAGDSAGGGLTLATLLNVRDKKLPLPRCAVTLSPGASCFPDEEQLTRLDKTESMLSADIIRRVINIYVPNAEDRKNPYASPALGVYTGLPPLMITVSNEELLYNDAKLVRAAAERDGVKVQWLERKGVFHVWPVMVPFLPEANKDFKEIIGFIKRNG